MQMYAQVRENCFRTYTLCILCVVKALRSLSFSLSLNRLKLTELLLNVAPLNFFGDFDELCMEWLLRIESWKLGVVSKLS